MSFTPRPGKRLRRAGVGLNFGVLSRASSRRRTGPPSALIQLSNQSIAEDAAAGANVGTLSVVGATGTPTFTFFNNEHAGDRFAIDGTALERGATELDYEAFQSHNITVSVSGMTPSPPDRVFTIDVTDVAEVISRIGLEDGSGFFLMEDTGYQLLETA